MDAIAYERNGLSPDTLSLLRRRGHELVTSERQGAAEVIVYLHKEDILEGGVDRRAPDGAAALVTR